MEMDTMMVEQTNVPNTEHIINAAAELIVARLLLADKVAAAKWRINKPIEDPAREQIILDALISKGSELCIDLNWVQRFFNDQFTASKMIQYELFTRWRQHDTSPTESISLQDDVRPAITELDNKLFQWATENLQYCTNLELDINKWTEIYKHGFNLDEIHARAFQKAISNLCLKNVNV